MAQLPTSGYARLNGLEMYWERHGDGAVPLVIVPGGYGTAAMLAGLIAPLAEHRPVIAVEMQGHGHTGDIDRPFSFEQFGDDLAALIRQLGFAQADLLGNSLGGGASLRCAIQNPDVIRRLVLVSAPYCRDAWFPSVRAAFDTMSSATLYDMLSRSPLYEAYSAVAPDPKAFGSLIDKTGELLRHDYDWRSDVEQLGMPTLLVYADSDSIPSVHAAEFFALLGGGLQDASLDGTLPTPSRLAILPGTSHYTVMSSPLLPVLVADFLG